MLSHRYVFPDVSFDIITQYTYITIKHSQNDIFRSELNTKFLFCEGKIPSSFIVINPSSDQYLISSQLHKSYLLDKDACCHSLFDSFHYDAAW